MDGELVDDDEVGNACNGVVSPFGVGVVGAKGREETRDNHDEISHDGDQDVGTAQAGQEGQIQEQEGSGQGPVDVAGPVDGAVDVLNLIDAMLLVVLDDRVRGGDAVPDRHGKVGDGGKGGDEGCQNMEQTFGLAPVSIAQPGTVIRHTAGTRKAKA